MHAGGRSRLVTLAVGLTAGLSGSAWAQTPPDEPTAAQRARIERCEKLPEEERRRTVECQTDAEQREDAYKKRLAEQLAKERDSRTSFLKWIHVDGLWVPTELGASTYGIIGTHIIVAEIGRLALYGPPGVMLLASREGDTWRMRPAFTWGVSVYLTDFRWPGSREEARLFLNVGKVWTTGDYRTGMDMAGLSVTWKR